MTTLGVLAVGGDHPGLWGGGRGCPAACPLSDLALPGCETEGPTAFTVCTVLTANGLRLTLAVLTGNPFLHISLCGGGAKIATKNSNKW